MFGPSGAIEALEAARKAGKIRFVGFTGHKSPDIHLKMLATARAHDYHFDTVQLPVNVMDSHYRSFGRHVVPELVKDEIGVLGMKPLGSGLFLRSAPMVDHAVTPTECLHYAMSQPTSVVITGCDTLGILMQGIDAAYRWHPMNEPEKQRGARAHGRGRGAWRVGKVQDHGGVRRNGSAPVVARDRVAAEVSGKFSPPPVTNGFRENLLR